jgi:peptidoglycan/LPS O-acetylase OafA/YrhL
MDVKLNHGTNASVHLDAIRGVAALTVFLSHSRPLFLRSGLSSVLKTGTHADAPRETSAADAQRTTVGHEAVIVFFVLSGYFVGGSVIRSMKKGSYAWKPYLFQRVTRLWVVLIPALLLGLAVDLAGMHLFGGPFSIYAAITQIPPGLVSRLSLPSLVGNLFFLQEIFFKNYGTNVALWSLACEFWYYIFFPLLLVALLPGRSSGRRALNAVLLLAAMLFCGRHVAQYFPLWLLGSAVAVLPLRIPASIQRLVTGTLTVLVLATFALCLRVHLNLYVADLWICFVFSALLWAIAHDKRVQVNSLYRYTAQSLARISYTLYSVHYPLLVFACALLMPVWSPQVLSGGVLVQILLVDLAVLIVSIGVYLLFEHNTDKIRLWLQTLPGGVYKAAAKTEPVPKLSHFQSDL